MYIYLIHSASTSAVSRVGRHYKKNKYTHVSIGLDQGLTEVYSFGRKQIQNPFIRGVVQEDLSKGLFADADCQVYRIKVTETEHRQMRADLQGHQERPPLNYTFVESLLLPLGIGRKRPKHYFSSEFVAAFLEKQTAIHFPQKIKVMTPQEIRNLPEMEFVYEGLISSYLELNELAKLGYPLAWDDLTVAY